jgi:ribosomal protein S12 methylthiotransferase
MAWILYGKRNLAELLKRVSDIPGAEWIRLHYAFPSQFPMDVLPVMAERSNICKYLDIPVQHHSDRMLKIMRRGITTRRSEELLYQIRESVPGIALRTTLLLGHPGETEEDFAALCEFVERFRFERLGVFTYSHEENTHAHTLNDDVPAPVKEERAARIMEIQQGISDAHNAQWVGKVMKVIVDRLEGEYFVGRTEYDSPEVDNEVFIQAAGQYLRLGDFAEVRITSHTPYDLYGERI